MKGLIVKMRFAGRVLLGDVRDVYRSKTGVRRLRVTHFNGEAWPIDPFDFEVDVVA